VVQNTKLITVEADDKKQELEHETGLT